jgi:hypothetical protein
VGLGWLVGCQIRCLLIIAATTDNGPFPTTFGLFSGGPGEARNNNRGSCLALMGGAPSIFGGTYTSTMAQ